MRTYLDSGVLLAAWRNAELRPAALRLEAEEFYTSEKPGKPMFRLKELKVISLHSL